MNYLLDTHACIHWLAVERMHCQQSIRLPLLHRDPFDRMLVAQALRHRFTVLTPDALWDRYGVSRLWA